MINVSLIDFSSIMAFWLCFTRWTAILMQIPLFDNIGIPSMVKVLSCLLITFAFFPQLKGVVSQDINLVGVQHFWYLTFYHLIVGLFIGFMVKAIMSIFTGAGSMITQQMGFSAMRYFDPSQVQSVGPFEMLLQWTVMIFVLTSGALLPMFKGIYGSFFSINLTSLAQLEKAPDYFFYFFKNAFMSGLLLSSPLIFANLLMMCVMGVIARTVPQMNILLISFAVNIGLGLFVFALTSEELLTTAFDIYTKNLADWFQFII